MSPLLIIFFVLIFAAVFLLVVGLGAPAFGEGGKTRKRLKRRLAEIEGEYGQGSFVSLLRQDYMEHLSPTQRWLEGLPGMDRLRMMIDQAGLTDPAWRVAATSLVLGLVAFLGVLLFMGNPGLALLAGLAGLGLPVMRIAMKRNARMEQFEQQLPDAIDLIKRALRAGQPFSTALKLVGDDMTGPVGEEFKVTSADLSYGNDPRRALMGLLSRVPSVALMGFVTAVLLQRETGGNLAEVLERISTLIRGRYRFQRRVRTLSAEGRMSAWVLTMVPITLCVLLMVIAPDYLPILFKTDRGQKLLVGAATLMVLGILWMRKIIRIQF
jgi:tight adherence protein B